MLRPIAPSAFRAAGSRPWLPVCSGNALQQRLFSSSPAHRGKTIITFGETSSPELSELLNRYRQQVILPTYLAAEQRAKIYKSKLKHILQNDPVTMEIDGVVHKFHHIERVSDLPSTHSTMFLAVDMMRTRADFRNLAPLLEGVQRAGRAIRPDFWPKAVRRAGQYGAISTILECIKAPERTGFLLKHHETLSELLYFLQLPAIKSGFNEAKTKMAYRQIQQVLDLIESKDIHSPKGKRTEPKLAFPFHRDPMMLAARLHMAAAQAVYNQGGQDEDGKVSALAEQIIALWPESKGLLDLQPDEAFSKRTPGVRYLLNYNGYLRVAAPLLNGLNLAAQLVDPALAMQLQNRADAVDNEVKAAFNAPERRKEGEGEKMYHMIFKTGEVEEAEEA